MPLKSTMLRGPLSHTRSPGVLLAGKLDIFPVSLPQHLKGVLQAFIVLSLAHQLSCGPADDLGILRSTDYSSRVCRIWRGIARNRSAGIKEITLKDTEMLLAFAVGTRMDVLYIFKKSSLLEAEIPCSKANHLFYRCFLFLTKTRQEELIKRVMLLFCSAHLIFLEKEAAKEMLIAKRIQPPRP